MTLILFLTLALIATFTTMSSGLVIVNGIPVDEVRIMGFLTCEFQPPPYPPYARPVLNITSVALRCAGNVTDLATAVSDLNGFYQIVYKTTETVLFNPSYCGVAVRLPVYINSGNPTRCIVYPPTGTLQASLTLVSFLQPLFKIVALLTAGPFKVLAP